MNATENSTSHFRTCNLCEAMCGLEIQLKNQKIVAVLGDKQDTFSRGHICPKAVGLQDIHEDPNRLRQPLKRNGNQWESISWEEAFDETIAQLQKIQKKYGKNSVATYLGNPNVHNYGSILFAPAFLLTLGTKNRFSATSVDQLPHMLAALLMFGHQLNLPIPDIDHTQFLLIMGANPAASNGSLMSAPDILKRIKEIRGRGGKVVVIDPRRSETAQVADQHFFIRPGRDALLLLALLHVVIKDGLAKPGRLREFTQNEELLADLVKDFKPARIAVEVGISANEITQLAHDFARTDKAICYGRMGLSVQEFGGLCQWLINLINWITGNLDRVGGVLFTKPAIDGVGWSAKLGQKGHFGRRHSRVRNLPEFGGEFPVATLAEEILTPGKGQIRALFTSAGNPVLSTPNGMQLEKALGQLEFMVCVDYYLNETTRFANIILPPTAALEHENYELAFHLLAIRNTAKYSPALFAAGNNTKHDWEIFLELQTRLESTSMQRTLVAKAKKTMLSQLGPEGIIDLGLRLGPYGSGINLLGKGINLKKLKTLPHGIDFGPLKPSMPASLYTSNKKINLAPKEYITDLERLKEHFKTSSVSGKSKNLELISRRQLRSNNSWMHNIPRLVKGKDRCTLLIHPSDAKPRNISSGDQVQIRSRTGEIVAKAEITEDIMAGVVCLPHGWGHHREGIRLDVAQAHAGVSINDITDEMFIDQLSGNSALSGVSVEVIKMP